MKIVILTAIILLLIARAAYADEPVDIARSQIGRGEIGGDNHGPHVKKYTKGKNVAWCAGFVSWCFQKSGKDVPYYLRALSYWNSGIFKKVRIPRAGDIIVFKRTGGGHVGIVEKVVGNKITIIEGNSGKYPARVKRTEYTLGSIKNLLGFVRI